MARICSMKHVVATLFVAFFVCGCQTSNNKLISAWKERSQQKAQLKGVEPEDKEIVSYWPYKAEKDKNKVSATTNQFRDKLGKDSDKRNLDARVAESLREGDGFRKTKQYEEARLAYTTALKLSPENPDILHRLAVIADLQMQYKTADEYYQAALQIRPRDANLLSDLGYSYWIRGDQQKAEKTLKQALEIDPSHKLAMRTLGTQYVQQNRQRDALAMFRTGTNSEVEAQSYLATILNTYPSVGPSGTNGSLPDVAPGAHGPVQMGPHQASIAMASSNRNTPEDLSQLNYEQIKPMMDRERQEAIRRRKLKDQLEFNNLPIDDGMEPSSRSVVNAPNPNSGRGSYSSSAIPNGPLAQDPAGYAAQQYGTQQYGNSPIASNGSPIESGMTGQNSGMNSSYNSVPQIQPMNAPYSGMNQNGGLNQTVSASDRSTSSYQGRNDFRGNYQQLPPSGPADMQSSGDPRTQQLGANRGSQFSDQRNASQMATQLAMNAGPGSMFPIVPVSENQVTPTFNTPIPTTPAPPVPPSSFNNRFGGEFPQTPVYQNSPNWAGNPNDQNSSPSVSSNRTEQIESVPNISPASPTLNWGPPTSASLNWQSGNSNNSANSTSWANDNAAGSGAAGSGIDSGLNLLTTDPNVGQRAGSVDRSMPVINSATQTRSKNDSSNKMYRGVWPNRNANALPSVQNPNDLENVRPTDLNNNLGKPLSDSGISINPAVQSGNSGISAPQYPYIQSR